MISVERSFYERFPRLAQGHGRTFSRPVVDMLRRIACEQRINDTLQRLQSARGFDFVEQALDLLDARYQVAHTDREHIPSEGRVVIVANHPLGAVDALSLLHLVGSVRRDVRILANDVLMQLSPLEPLLLPCRVFGGQGPNVLREAYRALERDEALILFPAGEVSRLGPQGVRDGRWSEGFVRFARRTGAPVLPVHVAARNSPTFYSLSMLAKPLATLMLPREMFQPRVAGITLTIGAQVPATALADPRLAERQVAQRMRAHVYRLPKRKPPRFATSSAIAHPENPQRVKQALAAATRLGQTSDGRQVLLLDPRPECAALREIGRLRELTFRRVGEGTGLKRDLDAYDQWYRHIVLWDAEALEIVGAYRIGEAGRILSERGREGLYTSSLFDYAPAADGVLAESVELGRSFVHPRHWGSRSLDYLWQGIGAYLRHHPEVRYLIGPVSLSASLPAQARAWIVAAHARWFPDADGLARARNPYRVPTELARLADARLGGVDLREGQARLKSELQALGAVVPALYRQYADLCEPDGVRFLDFGVDPGFGHCIDGLIRLDLARLKPAKRARYLGTSSPAAG